MDENYTCQLDKAMLKMAMDELNEVPGDRMGAVQTLRQWVLQQPHLNFLTETPVLLRFLRAAKFSQLRARQLIEGSLSVAAEMPRWFHDIDPREKSIQAFIDTGYIVPLPGRDEFGRKIFIYRMNKMDPDSKEYDKVSMMRAFACIFAYYLRDENVQVGGILYFMDGTDLHLRHQNMFTISELKVLTRMWQNALPMRFKGFHFYNSGTVMETLVSMLMPFLSKKFKERMHLHGSNLEGIYKVISKSMLPDEYLPDDYKGPSGGSIQNLIDDMKKSLLSDEFRGWMLKQSSSEYSIDLSKRPKNVPGESFRKINI